MRTTVRLPDELLHQAKERAARTGQTLTALIEGALRRELAAVAEVGVDPVRLPTATGSLRPGVNLDSNAQLLDLMDDEWSSSTSTS